MNIEEKELDKFAREIMNEIGSETPATGFTGKVMDRIENPYKSTIKTNPLISRRGWIILTTLFVTVYTTIFIFGTVIKPVSGQNSFFERFLDNFNTFFYSLSHTIISNPVILISVFVFVFLLLLDNLTGQKLRRYNKKGSF